MSALGTTPEAAPRPAAFRPRPTDGAPAIDFRDVSKRFGRLEVLRGISGRVEPGEVVVVCGPSGSGKSTLLRCINRLETIDTGQVYIAGGLAMHPRIMLFDEPTSALDPEMIKEVLDVMRGLVRDGKSMVVVTHEMGFAREVASRVLFMDEGVVVVKAPPAEFFAHPRHDRTRQFLGKILTR